MDLVTVGLVVGILAFVGAVAGLAGFAAGLIACAAVTSPPAVVESDAQSATPQRETASGAVGRTDRSLSVAGVQVGELGEYLKRTGTADLGAMLHAPAEVTIHPRPPASKRSCGICARLRERWRARRQFRARRGNAGRGR